MSAEAIEFADCRPTVRDLPGIPAGAAREWDALGVALATRGGRCVDVGPGAWDDPGSWSVAAELCAACPVLVECRAYAVAAREPEGLWGGLGPRERRT